MASIYKDKNGYWNGQVQIGYYDNGKRRYKRFKGRTKKEVQFKIDNYMLQTSNLAVIPDSKNCYIGEYIQSYIKIYKSNKLKPSSLTRDYGILNNQIKPLIGNISLQDLTTFMIQQQVINTLVQEGYSLSTIHKTYTLLNEACNKAVQENKILKNPCIGVEVPSKNVLKPKKIEILSREEIRKLLEAISTDRYKNGYGIALILYTGLRVGELCALKWGDIDFDNNVMNVHRNISVSYVEGKRVVEIREGTKTKASRLIPINNKAREILLKLKNDSKSDLVITSNRITSGENIVDIATIAKTYTRILSYAGINGDGKTGIHTLRHTFASQLIQNGVDIKVVSEILGHSSVSFTYNTYVHLFPKSKIDALDLLNY